MGQQIMIDTASAATSQGVWLYAGGSIVSNGLVSAETVAIQSEVKSGVWKDVHDGAGAAITLTATKHTLTVPFYGRYRVSKGATSGVVTVTFGSPSI